MQYVAFILIVALLNFIISMLITPPENKQGLLKQRVWFTRYTLLSFNILVIVVILYFILDVSGWK